MCLYLIVLLWYVNCIVAVTDFVKRLEPFKGLGAI